jgi:peptidoglycan/LPS O-acetylase OafA/YrhL
VIGSLTSLRFFAALAIVVHHSRAILLPASALASYPLDAGVSFFFVLSGFILTYVHSTGMNGMSRWTFYRSRFARIWPAGMFWTVVMVVVLPRAMYLPFYLLHWSALAAVPVALSFVTLVQSWIPIPAYYFGFNAPLWSVSNEAFFYLMFPMLLRSLTRSWHWKLLACAGAGFALVLLAERNGLAPFGPSTLGKVTLHGITYVNPVVRLKEFVLGMVAALLFLKSRRYVRVNRWIGSLLEVAVLVALPYAVRNVGVLRSRLMTTASPAAATFVDQTSTAVFFGLLVLVFAMNAGVVSRVLSLRPFVVLGEISFSLYVLHQIVINYYQVHPSYFGWIPQALFFTTFLSLMLVLAYLTWRWVEMPARDRLRGERRVPTAPVAESMPPIH